MANNTYIGGEIKLIGGLSDLFAIDSNIIRYTKTDNEEISIQQIINELLGRINALEESNITKEYDLKVSLTGCSSATLKPGKISENGGTYTVTADTHYNLPSSIEVKQGSTILIAGTHYNWSNGSLIIFQGITGPISVTITATLKSYNIRIEGNATGNKPSVIYTTSDVQVTLTPNRGYTITGTTVTGATKVSFSNNIVTFNNITGDITITAQTEEIVLRGVTVTRSSGTGTLSDDIVSLTGKGSSITLILNPTPNTALNKTMTLTATDSVNTTTDKLGLSTPTVNSDGTVTVSLIPTGAISGAKLKISNNKGTVLKTLKVDVADGSTTGISVNGTSSSLSASGGAVTLTATVTSTKFNPGAVKWTTTGGSFKDNINTGNSVTFKAPENTSETTPATYTITATCDGKSATYSVTVAKKAASTKYYWYVGNSSPEGMTPPNVGNANTTLCEWTDLGTSLPTTSIKVYKEDENYDNHTWYVSAPSAAGFTIYNGLNAQPDLGWTKSKTFMIGNVSYDLWISGSKFDTANIYLHK